MEDKKSPSTETSYAMPEAIKKWLYIYMDEKEPKVKQMLLKIDVPDNVDDEEWESLDRHIDMMRDMAIEEWKHKKEEDKKRTFNDVLHREIYRYDKPHPEIGVIIEKVCVDRYKHGDKNPIPSTEVVVETFLSVDQPENNDALWVDDDVLDDLMERGIEDIRIMVGDEIYFVDTKVFLTYGKMKNNKVFIEIRKPPFEVTEFHNEKNFFNVYAPVI